MTNYVSHATNPFPGGFTTATILDTLDGSYRVTVVTRFHSGNYLTERDEAGLSLAKAKSMMAFYGGHS